MQTEKQREYSRKWRALNVDKPREYKRNNYHKNIEEERAKARRKYSRGTQRKRTPESKMLYDARTRAKKTGVPCTIGINDIIIPFVCPILGISIKKSSNGTWSDNSPSLDRIIPQLGYIPGNIAVISHRANVIKSYGTAEEHQKISEWIIKNA